MQETDFESGKKFDGTTASDISALVVNPESGVAKKVIELLLENGVPVCVKASQTTAKDLPPNWSDNSLLTFFIGDEEGFPHRRFRYVLFFLKNLEDIGRIQKVSQNYLPGAKLLLAVPSFFSREKIAEISRSPALRIAVLAPELGPEMDLRQDNLVTRLIRSFLQKKPLLINPKEPGVSLAPTDNLAHALLETLFTGERENIKWFIPEPVSLSSLLSVFSTLTNTTLAVQSDPRAPKSIEFTAPPAGVPYWSPKTPLYEAARLTVDWFAQHPQAPVPNTRTSSFQPQPPTRVVIPKVNLFKISVRFPQVILLFLFLAFLAPGLFALNLFWNTWQTTANLSAGKPDQAVKAAKSSFNKIVFFDQLVTASKPLATAVGLESFRQGIIRKISTIETLTYAEISSLRLFDKTRRWLLGQNISLPPSDLQENFSQTAEILALASFTLSQNQAWLNNLPLMGGYFASWQKKIPSLRQAVLDGRELLPHFKKISGFDQPRTYLVLFQNNMELRPTGGFIGSFGLATVKEGRLADFEVNDVYVADGQLKGHVEPPAPIRDVLGEASWTLRDSNWDPDFPTSASRAQWFLEKEIGRRVDGTIAVTLNLAQDLLKATGPLKLPDYQEEINADNLYERAQYKAEANFFPGSTQKKDYLGAVARALFSKLKNPSAGQLLQLIEVLNGSIAKKDIQVYFTDPELQATFSRLGWTGEVRGTVTCPLANCTADDLLFVDSNLGVNKANYFLKRRIADQIIVSSAGEVSHQLTVTYQNTATSDRWPAGRYRSYARFYLPLETKIDQVSLKNPSTGLAEKPSATNETEEHKRFILGLPLEVPVQETREVTINYHSPQRIDLTQGGSYLLFLQKQAGTIADPYEITISFPPNIKIVSVYPALKDFALSNIVRYNLLLSGDQRIQLNFIQSP